ncbi:hypothetical protein BN946_scf184687.g5 [Trametes cinnabarina]|uniref:Uncharacterized protein n=1 Tax=Pycnoporus cinnabarinus TaxID=5643 RepID=A0A060S5T8_PYCCI|nr:hypothetical protein BN946_scf184687.g5 [Trametes cinnabarina]
MAKPRNSVLYLFDPLHQESPSAPRRDTSPELGASDKENDASAGDVTMFFNRACGISVKSPQEVQQPRTPKGKLIDFGDTPAMERLWDEAEHEGSDADGEQSECEAECMSEILAPLRSPLADLPVEETPRPRPLRAPVFSAPTSASRRSEGRIEALLAAPHGSPLAEVINSINLSALTVSENTTPTAEHPPTLEVEESRPPSPFPEINIHAPETPIRTDFDVKHGEESDEVPAMTGSTLRPTSTLTQLSPDDPRRTSVDLYSSFHLQMQSADMSFDLLNDKISFLGNGQDSFWAAGESADDAMFDFDEEKRAPPMEKRRLSLSDDHNAILSLERVFTPPVSKSPIEQSLAVRSPTEDAARVPLPMSPPSSTPSPRVTPPRVAQQNAYVEPPSPPTSPMRLDEPSLLLESEPLPPPMPQPVPALRILKKTFKVTGRQPTPPVARPDSADSSCDSDVTDKEVKKASPESVQPASVAALPPVRPAIRGVQRPPASMLAAGRVVIGLPPQGAARSTSVSTSSSSSSGSSSASRVPHAQDASASASVSAASRFAAAGVRRPTLVSKERPAVTTAKTTQAPPARTGLTRTASANSTSSSLSKASASASGLRPPSRIAAAGTTVGGAGSALPRPASKLPFASGLLRGPSISGSSGIARPRSVTAPRAPTGGRF